MLPQDIQGGTSKLIEESNIYKILLGIAIGDAFGAGVEFQDRDWIRANVDFTKIMNVRHQIKVPKDQLLAFTENYHEWDYTDDTEMTIAVIKALNADAVFSESLLVEKWTEEYLKGKEEKGYGRNGHGSMSWYFCGDKTIDEIRSFQKDRLNPGNAPAMRSVPLGLIPEKWINQYAEINARATHPNINAILSSQCIAQAAHFLIVKQGNKEDVIDYCCEKIALNDEYKSYFKTVNRLGDYDRLSEKDFTTLCGDQPIKEPYFLSGIKGVPSDSKYTTGSVLFILKNSMNAFDALMKSVNLGGDVDSIASITTGIVAGINGLDSIPAYMLEKVEGTDYLRKIAKGFEENLSFS